MSIIFGANSDLTELLAQTKASATQVSITHPDPTFTVTVTGTANKDLIPNTTDFVEVLNGYSEVLNYGDGLTVLPDGRIKANRDVLILVVGYADISIDQNSATVGVAFSIEVGGVRNISPRSVHARIPNIGDLGNISGNGITFLPKDAILGLAVASDKSGNVSFRSSSLSILEIKI